MVGGGREAKALFGYSILYLFVLFAVLLIDHALFGSLATGAQAAG